MPIHDLEKRKPNQNKTKTSWRNENRGKLPQLDKEYIQKYIQLTTKWCITEHLPV